MAANAAEVHGLMGHHKRVCWLLLLLLLLQRGPQHPRLLLLLLLLLLMLGLGLNLPGRWAPLHPVWRVMAV